MPFWTRCPTCARTFQLADSASGQDVRCPDCNDLFAARERSGLGDLPPTEASVGDPGGGEVGVYAAAEVGSRPMPGEALSTSSSPGQALVSVGASMAGAYMLLALSIFVAAFTIYGLLTALREQPVAVPPAPQPAPAPHAELPPAIAEAVDRVREVNQGKVPADIEKLLADNKGKLAADFPPPPPSPFADPTDLDHALALTRDPFWIRRKTAAAWIARAPVNPARRADVNHALLEMLRDGQVLQHETASSALLVWADAAAATELVALAQQERLAGAPAALLLLAQMKDDRAAPIAALQLGHFLKRSQAIRVLETLGAMAEKDVGTQLAGRDRATRSAACRVLGRIGTAASLPLLNAAIARDRLLAGPGKQAIAAIKTRMKE